MKDKHEKLIERLQSAYETFDWMSNYLMTELMTDAITALRAPAPAGGWPAPAGKEDDA